MIVNISYIENKIKDLEVRESRKVVELGEIRKEKRRYIKQAEEYYDKKQELPYWQSELKNDKGKNI